MENKDIDKHYVAFCSVCGEPMPVFAIGKPSDGAVFTHTKCKELDDIDKAARKKSILSPFRIKKIMDILLDLSEPNSNAPCYTARMILDNDFEIVAEALSESMSFPDYNTVGLLELHRLKEETLSGNGNGFTDGFYDAWKFLEKHVDSRQSEIDELVEVLKEITRGFGGMFTVAPCLKNEPCYIKATRLLKRYENEKDDQG